MLVFAWNLSLFYCRFDEIRLQLPQMMMNSKGYFSIDQTAQFAITAASALEDTKGKDIVILKLTDVSSIADYFVIATGDGNVHIKALADKVRTALSKQNKKISHTEGFESKNWVLLDYYSVVIHIFSDDAREYYSLENLWGDAIQLSIENGELKKAV